MSSLLSRFDAGRTALTLGLVVSIVAIAIAFRLFNGSSGGGTTATAPEISAIPNLALPDLQGKQENIADYRGRPLFVNMWATWCPPCRAEIPDLQRLYAAKKSTGFAVLGVDQGQEAEPVSMFVSDYKLTYPILIDQAQRLSTALGSNGLPTTLVYDRAGKLVDVVTGMMSDQVMQAEYKKAQTE